MTLSSKKISKDIHKLVKEEKYSENLGLEILNYLIINKIDYLLPNIIKNLKILSNEEDILNTCNICSSHKLSEETIENIKSKLNIKSNSTNTKVDRELVGGFVVEHSGIIYDASISNTLRKAKILLAK
jgi:F0F1-type ATP synthase delta subunit